MTDERLRVVIEFEGKDAERKAKQFSKTLGETGKKAEKSEKDFAKMGKQLIKVGVAFAGVTVAIKGAKKVWDFSEEGAKLLRLEQAGHQLAKTYGADMDRIVDHVKAASLGTVAEMDIIASANKALMLGVADTAEEMAQLMEVAAVRGRAMGLSTQQAFNDLVTGIGRASPLILDNLGIVTGGIKTYKEYAKSIGKSVDTMTDAEKKQALFNKAVKETQPLLEQMGGLVQDTAGEYETLGAYVKDSADEIKKAFAEDTGPIVAAINRHNALNKAVWSLGVTFKIGTGYVDEFGNVVATTKDELIEAAETTSVWHRGMAQAGRGVGRLSGVVGEFDDSLGGLDLATRIYTEGLTLETIALWENEAALRADKAGVDALRAALEALAPFLKMSAGGSAMWAEIPSYDRPGYTGTRWEGIPAGGFATWDEGIAAGGKFVGGQWVEDKQGGGPLGRGWTLVGDPGPQQELIYRGWVFDAKTTKKLLEGGLVPGTRRGGTTHKPYYDPPTYIEPQYPYSEASPPASEYTSSAALAHYWGTGGGASVPFIDSIAGVTGGAAATPQVVEAAVIASVAAATDIAGVQAKAMKDTVAAQRMDARRTEALLAKLVDINSQLLTADDARDIADESGNTSGF